MSDEIRWTGENIAAVMAFMHPQEPVHVNDLSHLRFSNADDLVGVETRDGLSIAARGDWIIRDERGELVTRTPKQRLEAAVADLNAKVPAYALRVLRAVTQEMNAIEADWQGAHRAGAEDVHAVLTRLRAVIDKEPTT